MLIKQLEVIVYPQPGYKSHEELKDDPDWPEIDAAIRRLDRHEYPFLELYLAEGEGFDCPPSEYYRWSGRIWTDRL